MSNYKKPENSNGRISKPKTLDELRQYCITNNLPENKIRTYIGKDVNQPKCYGIFKDVETGKFVVYKNKADGTRAVRYEGFDEAEAVGILYEKIHERVQTQKQNLRRKGVAPTSSKAKRARQKAKDRLIDRITTGGIIVVIAACIIASLMPNKYKDGYYKYENTYYYSYNDSWWSYDDETDNWNSYYWADDTWEPEYAEEYYEGETYSYDSGINYDFDSFYEDNYSSSDSDYSSSYSSDDSWDWGSDDWDSSYDDWDSDW